jgi:L-fuconolactonase
MRQLADVATLASKVPGTRLVVDHCGGHHQLGGASLEKRTTWQLGLKQLAGCRNVWVKLSGLMGAQGGSGLGGACEWQVAQAESLRVCVETIPSDRMLFGGDWPVSKLTAPLHEWVSFASHCLEGLAEEEREAIFWRNAHEVYRLDETQSS